MKNIIKEEIQKTKQLKEYAKNMLCISIIVFIIQAIVVILNGRYYGNIFEKLQQFYSDKSIYLKARAVPVFVFINFFDNHRNAQYNRRADFFKCRKQCRYGRCFFQIVHARAV